jgi:predicted Holliday junction resolvase-like endonuclease
MVIILVLFAHRATNLSELQQSNKQLLNNLESTSKELQILKSQQQSKSVRLGLLAEQIIPLKSDFPFDYKNLVPMFRPIDYIVFEQDRIVFLEIKMGKSQMSDKQKNIARLIREGKVEFVEYRISEEGINVKV